MVPTKEKAAAARPLVTSASICLAVTNVNLENLPQNTPISKSTNVARRSYVQSHNYSKVQKHTLNARRTDQSKMIDGELKVGLIRSTQNGAKSRRILGHKHDCIPEADSSSDKCCETTIVRDLIKEEFMLLRTDDRKDKGWVGIEEASFGEGSGLRRHSSTGQQIAITSRDNMRLCSLKGTANSCEGTDSPKKLLPDLRTPTGEVIRTPDGQRCDLRRANQGNVSQNPSKVHGCKHKQKCELWKLAEGADTVGRLAVGQLPSAASIAEKRVTSKSSSLQRAVSAQRNITHEIKYTSTTKRSRKLSLERVQQERSCPLDTRQSNRKVLHCTTGGWNLDVPCICDPLNSVEETPLPSRSVASSKQENITKPPVPKRGESLETSSSRNKAENGMCDSSKLLLTTEDTAASQSQEANFSHGQFLRRRWSIERINSYSFDPKRPTYNEENVGKVQSTRTENLRLDSMPSVGDRPAQMKARIFRKERHRKLSDTTWMKTPHNLNGVDNMSEALNSLVISSKGSTKNSCKKVIDRPKNMEHEARINRENSKVDDVEGKVKEGKTQNAEHCKKFNVECVKTHNTVNRNFSDRRRRMARELLRQKLFQNVSDSDSYSDDDLWKEVKIVMRSEKLKGILRVKTPERSKTVTFNNKVKMKTVYCL